MRSYLRPTGVSVCWGYRGSAGPRPGGAALHSRCRPCCSRGNWDSFRAGAASHECAKTRLLAAGPRSTDYRSIGTHGRDTKTHCAGLCLVVRPRADMCCERQSDACGTHVIWFASRLGDRPSELRRCAAFERCTQSHSRRSRGERTTSRSLAVSNSCPLHAPPAQHPHLRWQGGALSVRWHGGGVGRKRQFVGHYST